MLYTAWFKIVLLRKYQVRQPTYISNIGLCHAMYSRYMLMKCKWWMTLYTAWFFLFLNTDIVGSINTRNICLILSTIYSFISVSVFIDMGPSTLLWPKPILLLRQPWPYVIHHLHFMNMYRLYIAKHWRLTSTSTRVVSTSIQS
jgi:hypothetical protein